MLSSLEDVRFKVARRADARNVIVADNIRDAPCMVKRDIGIHRHDAAIRRDVGNGEIRISGFFLGGCGVEVLQRVHHTGADTLIRIVGSGIVDGVGFLVADIRASLFRHGNQVRGGHHVLGIIEVNQTNHRHVRLRKRHRRGQLDGNILRT